MTKPKPSPSDVDDDGLTDKGEPDAEAEATEAAGEILSPAMPPVGGGVMLDADPRLNQPSETEAELDELVEAEDEDAASRKEGD
jgi:hypothetical protein